MSDSDPSAQPKTLEPPKSEKKAPSRTGYTYTDDPWLRTRNTFRYLTGRLTAEGERQYLEARNERYSERDCQRCEKQRDYLLQYSIYTHSPNPPSFSFPFPFLSFPFP